MQIPLNELKKAVALKYDGEAAPRIIAKGEHALAEEIIALAKERNIPLCDNPALVDLLSRIDIGEDVPEELYLSVAYILAFAYRLSDGATS